ncbi:MAG: long-chain fatty acid--CoA ligase, partial [Nocardioidaceae bacterium]|nr:long-chain fatty acid--CoA ligase [Nocardioidaceae bacterium]
MREFASPGTIDLPTTGNLTDDVVRQAEQSPERALLAVPGPDGWTDVTADRFHDQVRRVARGLAASGIERGDRVLLLCSTRYEWTLFDYAIWFAGAVSVPVYVTSSPEQVAGILEDSGAIGAVVESAAHADLVRKAAGSEPGPRTWCVDGGAVDDLTRVGAAFTDDELETRRRSATPDTVATLVYTSGTTGRPQGCMLTHGNLMAEVRVAVAELDTLFQHDGAGTLLLLPPAHVFARVVQVGAIHAGVRLGHTGDVRALMQDLASFRPTFVLAVPRVFEKVFTAISQQAAADGRGRLFDRAVETAIAYRRASDSGRPGPVLRARHAVFERRVYAPMRATLGGRCRYAVSGGAPLGERLTHFFRGAGLTILEGYGLTETTAAVTVNRPDQAKLGSVGRPLGGVTVRVGDEGELQVRGPQVFPGYWNAPEATDDVLDDEGWLRTGDLGEIDDEGFVRVTGRKKEILVTAGG